MKQYSSFKCLQNDLFQLFLHPVIGKYLHQLSLFPLIFPFSLLIPFHTRRCHDFPCSTPRSIFHISSRIDLGVSYHWHASANLYHCLILTNIAFFPPSPPSRYLSAPLCMSLCLITNGALLLCPLAC